MKGAVAARQPRARGFDPVLLGGIATLGACGLALDVISNGDVVATLVPVALAGLLALVWFVPLRWSLIGLFLLGIVLEAPYEAFAAYRFRTPWYLAGSALLGNLNLVTRVSALKFSGFDAAALYLFLVHAVRRARRSTIDGTGFVPLPEPTLVGVALSIASMLLFWAWGLSTGGDFNNSLWQVQKPLYIPLLVLLLHAGVRGAADLPAFGAALLLGGVYRAALAVYIHFNVFLPDGTPLPVSTTHADSMLFSAALLLLLVMRNERVPGARKWWFYPATAIILAGMVCNGRRLVWISAAGALLIVALVSPWTPLKRRVARVLLVAAPLFALYVRVGWNSKSAAFAPAAMARSVLDPTVDASTLWREQENASLVRNIGSHPFFGVGFGHEYVSYESMGDISGMYPQYRYIPHNSVLASFAFAGAIGVAGIWSLLIATVFLAARAYHRACRPCERAGALMCLVVVFGYLNQVYGDIGVSQWLGPLTVAPAALFAGKLAVQTGAWPGRTRAAGDRNARAERAEAEGQRVADGVGIAP